MTTVYFGTARRSNDSERRTAPGVSTPLPERSERARGDCEDPRHVGLAERSQALVDGLLLLCKLHRMCEKVQLELTIQVSQYLNGSESERVWLKRAKHLLAYPIALYLRNRPPPEPDNSFRPSGALRRWMKQRICCFNRRNTHLWYSWYQAKRCALPASEDLILQAYRDHRTALTTPDRGVDQVIERVFENETFQRVLDSVAELVAEALTPNTNVPIPLDGAGESYWQTHAAEKQFFEYMPSNNACFERTRARGGQRSDLLESVEMIPHDNLRESRCNCGRTRGERHQEQCISLQGYWGSGHAVMIHTEVLKVARIKPALFRSVGGEYRQDPTNVVYVYETIGRDLWSDGLQQRAREHIAGPKIDLLPDCMVQAVLEPMKIRMISKGPSLPYYLCKPIQQAMNHVLRKMDCFRLLGRAFCPTDLMDLRDLSRQGDKWFSIDYSAATDNLSWKYSSKILDVVTSRLTDNQRKLCLQVLGPHQLWYPANLEDPEDTRTNEWLGGVQASGQLMGSILSFPILCLANLGIYLDVTDELHRQRGLTYGERLRAVLVNGDDMVYAAPEELWDSHIEVGGACGLEMSIGKAYVHDEYANVNSTCVHFDLKKAGTTPFVIPFLNLGLMFGQRKVQESENRIRTLSSMLESGTCSRNGTVKQVELALRTASNHHSDLDGGFVLNIPWIIDGSPDSMKHDALKLFLSLNKKEIAAECQVLLNFTPADKAPRDLLVPSTDMDTIVPSWLYTQVDAKKPKRSFHTRNLFVPRSLGGMGLVPPHVQTHPPRVRKTEHGFAIEPAKTVYWKYRITDLDRSIAASRRFESRLWESSRPFRSAQREEPIVLEINPWDNTEPIERLPEMDIYTHLRKSGREVAQIPAMAVTMFKNISCSRLIPGVGDESTEYSAYSESFVSRRPQRHVPLKAPKCLPMDAQIQFDLDMYNMEYHYTNRGPREVIDTVTLPDGRVLHVYNMS